MRRTPISSASLRVTAEVAFLLEYDEFTKIVGPAEIARIETLVGTMRPQESSVRGYIKNILSQREERFARFRAALLQVVRADGIISLPEEDFLDDLDRLRVTAEIENRAAMEALGLADPEEFRRPINRGRQFSPDRE